MPTGSKEGISCCALGRNEIDVHAQLLPKFDVALQLLLVFWGPGYFQGAGLDIDHFLTCFDGEVLDLVDSHRSESSHQLQRLDADFSGRRFGTGRRREKNGVHSRSHTGEFKLAFVVCDGRWRAHGQLDLGVRQLLRSNRSCVNQYWTVMVGNKRYTSAQ
jgi:hypothetical protein